jgi:hypothetical protein
VAINNVRWVMKGGAVVADKTQSTGPPVRADRSINPDQERMMAKRAHAKTVEMNASHVAYMSHPKETAKLIEEAATSARSKSVNRSTKGE